MILQLNPPLPVVTPKGRALAHFMIDEGIEHDIKWVCFQDSTGECWTFKNPEVRAQKNLTQGRDYISPFYDPDDVALPKDHFEAPVTGIYKFEDACTTNELLSGLKDRQEEKKAFNDALSAEMYSKFNFPDTPLQKQVKEAKRMYETPLPSFEDLVKDANSIANNSHQKEIQDKISKVASELRGNEMKILDDFCKTYYAAVGHMTGKEFMSIVNDVTLNVQQFFKDGQVGTRYWFSPKENDENR
jgi:hypothetical protein